MKKKKRVLPDILYDVRVEEGERHWTGVKRYYIRIDSFNGEIILVGELRMSRSKTIETATLLHGHLSASRLWIQDHLVV